MPGDVESKVPPVLWKRVLLACAVLCCAAASRDAACIVLCCGPHAHDNNAGGTHREHAMLLVATPLCRVCLCTKSRGFARCADGCMAYKCSHTGLAKFLRTNRFRLYDLFRMIDKDVDGRLSYDELRTVNGPHNPSHLHRVPHIAHSLCWCSSHNPSQLVLFAQPLHHCRAPHQTPPVRWCSS